MTSIALHWKKTELKSVYYKKKKQAITIKEYDSSTVNCVM